VIGVTLQSGESIDRALRRFKRKAEKSGVIREYRARTAFMKPSIKNRLRRIKSARRQYRISKEMV